MLRRGVFLVFAGAWLSDAILDDAASAFEDADSLVLLQRRSDVIVHHRKPVDEPDVSGKEAPLNERGYQAVADLKDDEEMKMFIRRAAAELGYTIPKSGAGGLKGFTPYFSGNKTKRTFNALEKELTRIAGLSAEKSWLLPKGTSATLDEEGFNKVQKLRDPGEMEPFIRRLAEDLLDMEPEKLAGLKGFAPFFAGKNSEKTFSDLQDELREESKRENSWLAPIHGEALHVGEECAEHCEDALKNAHPCNMFCGKGHYCLAEITEVSGKSKSSSKSSDEKSDSDEDSNEKFVCTKSVSGAGQPMDEEGFKVVQSLKNSTQMDRFVRKILNSLDLAILNEKALKVVVPFYSGEKDRRTFKTLMKELETVGNQTESWLSRRGNSAPLDQTGFVVVKKLQSVPEMAKFIRRAVDAKGFYVRNDGWLNGLASFYSAERTKNSFAALMAEIRGLGTDPNIGRKGDKDDPKAKKDADKTKADGKKEK